LGAGHPPPPPSHPTPAFCPKVSADMIHDAGFDWVILGHSERRSLPEIRRQAIALFRPP